MEHNILITQLQYSGAPEIHNLISGENKYLHFKHPVKELLWTYINYYDNNQVTIKFNEFNKLYKRDNMYFTYIQPFQNHTNIPNDNSVYVYSFSLNPEDYQPSGTCNFSRLKSSQIISSHNTGIEVYAVNYNILKIVSGMGAVLFS